jgi:nuclear cap-binding protein subunit 1
MEDFKALCNDINTLGETPKKYVEDVEFMSTPIVKNFESEDFRKAVLQTLFAVVTEQPQKILHISGLVQSVYSQAPDSAKIIVEFFHQEAQVLLEKAASRDAEPISSDTGPWNKIKLLMRFWASLSLILDTSSVVNVFSQFLKLSVDLQNNTPEKRSPLGEAIYYNTLISLPYLSPFHPDQSEVQHGANKVLQLAKEFKFVASEVTITKPFSESSEHQPYTPKEIVTCVLPALEEYFADTDKTNLFLDLQSMLGGLLSPAEKMTLPALALPTVDSLKEVVGLDTGLGSVDGMWRTPRFTMEVYLPIGDLHTTPSSSSYIGLLFRDIITDVIEAVEFNRKEVARQIITIDLFFNDAIFAPPGSSIDSLKKLNEQNKEGGTSLSTWKIEDIAVETILSLIFKLPTASQPSVYFYTTLVEACVNAPQAIAQVIGRAIRFFYANVYHLDFELNLRYLDWLSIQLSNFNFTWKWNEWEGDSVKFGKSNYHPRVVFIRNLVAKELRLGTRERIQATLTPEFQQYLDVSLFTKKELFVYYKNILGDIEDSEESLNLLYLCDQLPIKANVEKLIEVIHKNLPSAELEDAVQQLKVAIESFQNADELLVSIMFQAVAFVGSKSTSHAGKCIDSTREQLKKLVDIADASDDASGDVQMQEDNVSLKKQIWAINAVLAYWNQDPQSGYLVLDVLESFNIISPLAIIQHSLDDERKANLGLVNIASIESILRTLTKVVFSGSGTSELEYIFESLLSIISKIVSTLGTEGSIHIPDVSAEITDDIEFSWKYHTTLGLIRTVLRKFSDEYSGMAPALVSTLEKTVTHKDTVTIVSSWIKDLQSL